MMDQNEYKFFVNNAPQGVFTGQGVSMFINEEDAVCDFDIIESRTDKKDLTTLWDMEKKGYVSTSESSPEDMGEVDAYEQDGIPFDAVIITVTLTKKGFESLKEAKKKYEVKV